MLSISLVIVVIFFIIIITWGCIIVIWEIKDYIKRGTPRNLYSGISMLYLIIILIFVSFLSDLIIWHFVDLPELMFKIAILAVLVSFFIPFLFLKRVVYFFHFRFRGDEKEEDEKSV